MTKAPARLILPKAVMRRLESTMRSGAPSSSPLALLNGTSSARRDGRLLAGAPSLGTRELKRT
jgi:hypothetical protein